jgi:hypothetical protein
LKTISNVQYVTQLSKAAVVVKEVRNGYAFPKW